jgi:hypothetical protein
MVPQAFYLQQAETCLALARTAIDPVLRRRYEDLAVDFSEELGLEAPQPGHDRAFTANTSLDRALAAQVQRARSH